MSFASSNVLHGQRGAPVKVLIADDHPVVRQGLKMMLSSDPELEVVGEARDGDEAFEKAHSVDWDVAVLDYSMPGRGGVELLADVKHDYPDRPVLILSIYPEDPHGLRALKAGAAGYVLKTEADQDLVAAVRAVQRGEPFLTNAAERSLVREWMADDAAGPREPLTPREREVVKLIAEAHTNRSIAETLHLAEKTVESHRANVLRKLGMRDRVELVRYAIRRGLIEP